MKKKIIKTFKSSRRIKLNFKISYRSVYILAISGLLVVFSGMNVWFYESIVKTLPNFQKIKYQPKMTTTIYSKDGEILYHLYENENRYWLSQNQIPEVVVKATLAIEDKDFYRHHGISWTGLIRALWHNWDNGSSLQGGSTITQQLVKNVYLTFERSWERKLKELILSLWVERNFSKNEILTRYLNQVAYGGELYGVAAASEKYFGKELSQITLAEAAYLAGLPAAPSIYSPMKGNLGKDRQLQVLREMEKIGFISHEERIKAENEELRFNFKKEDIKAPHFVFYVLEEIDKLGVKNPAIGGYKIYTSLDLNLQEKTEQILRNEVDKLIHYRINNGAVLVTNVKNGEVLAMVGSKDYWDKSIEGQFNVVTGQRQPGSSIKPLNYLLALEKGSNLLERIEDSPVSFQIKGQKPYIPKNYTGRFMGSVTLKTALASSLNIPSVKLLNKNGVDNLIALGRKMGITTWTESNSYGLSLALGAGEVKMIDLAQAYSTLANLGRENKVHSILRVDDYLDRKIYEHKPRETIITDERYAYLINRALSDNRARAPIFGTNSKLVIPGKTVAVKTGTTNSMKDNWCIGWTDEYLTASWVGNNDGKPMSYVASGVTGATPIWNMIMSEVLEGIEDRPWRLPSGIAEINYCGQKEYVIEGSSYPPCFRPTPTQNPTNNQ